MGNDENCYLLYTTKAGPSREDLEATVPTSTATKVSAKDATKPKGKKKKKRSKIVGSSDVNIEEIKRENENQVDLIQKQDVTNQEITEQNAAADEHLEFD